MEIRGELNVNNCHPPTSSTGHETGGPQNCMWWWREKPQYTYDEQNTGHPVCYWLRYHSPYKLKEVNLKKCQCLILAEVLEFFSCTTTNEMCCQTILSMNEYRDCSPQRWRLISINLSAQLILALKSKNEERHTSTPLICLRFSRTVLHRFSCIPLWCDIQTWRWLYVWLTNTMLQFNQ